MKYPVDIKSLRSRNPHNSDFLAYHPEARTIVTEATLADYVSDSHAIKNISLVDTKITLSPISALSNCNLFGDLLSNASFENASVESCDFQACVAERVNFNHTAVNLCSFSLADLEGISFCGAEINHSYFIGTNLTNTDFSGTTIFDNTIFIGSNAKKAVGLEGGILTAEQLNEFLTSHALENDAIEFIHTQLTNRLNDLHAEFKKQRATKGDGFLASHYINDSHLDQISTAIDVVEAFRDPSKKKVPSIAI